MKTIFLKLFVKWYLKDIREFIHLSAEEEIDAYTFRDPEKTEKLIKSLLTYQTIKHFEAQDDKERQWAKGAGVMLKIMLDAHRAARKIVDENTRGNRQDNTLVILWDEALKRWSEFKKRFLTK